MVGGTGYSTHSTPGHSNRIFSLKFHPLDSNTIVSGEPLPSLSGLWIRESGWGWENRRIVQASLSTAKPDTHTHPSALSLPLP
jgi:hypothetical protein